MITASVFTAAAVVLAFTPSEVLVGVGVLEPHETELLRWGGAALFVQALLVTYMARRGITDAHWHRIVAAGDVALVLGVAYVVSGNPFFLIIGFSTLVAVVARTMMPVLDHWSDGVRTRWDRGV